MKNNKATSTIHIKAGILGEWTLFLNSLLLLLSLLSFFKRFVKRVYIYKIVI